MADPHDHCSDEVLWPDNDPYAHWPVDRAAFAKLFTASVDQCEPCRSAAADIIAADPYSTARVVVAAAAALQSIFGMVPPSMADPDDEQQTAHGRSREFRIIMRAGAADVPGAHMHERMPPAAETMTVEQRRHVAVEAAKILAAGAAVFDI